MTLLWFVIWFISDRIGDREPLTFDPLTGGRERCSSSSRSTSRGSTHLIAANRLSSDNLSSRSMRVEVDLDPNGAFGQRRRGLLGKPELLGEERGEVATNDLGRRPPQRLRVNR
jgi:hypothetical protein